jgi:hypothetical protein
MNMPKRSFVNQALPSVAPLLAMKALSNPSSSTSYRTGSIIILIGGALEVKTESGLAGAVTFAIA